MSTPWLMSIVLFALAFTEISQQTFSILLFTQTLFQFVQTAAQRLRLFCQMTLIDAVAQ